MKYATAALLSIALIVTALPGRAETNVVEAFACNFLPGKTMEDLSAATDYYTSRRSRIDSPALQKLVSRVWTQATACWPIDGSLEGLFSCLA